MQTFDQALLKLYKAGIIDEEEALNNATSRSDMKLKIEGLSSGTATEAETAKISSSDSDVIDLKI